MFQEKENPQKTKKPKQPIVGKPLSLEWLAFYIMLFSFSGAFFITYPLAFVISSSSAVLNLYIGLVCAAEITSLGLLIGSKACHKKAFRGLTIVTLVMDVLTILLGLVTVMLNA